MRLVGRVETTFHIPGGTTPHYIRLRKLGGVDKADYVEMVRSGASVRQRMRYIMDNAVLGFILPHAELGELKAPQDEPAAAARAKDRALTELDDEMVAWVLVAFSVQNDLMGSPGATALWRAWLVAGHEGLPAEMLAAMDGDAEPGETMVARAEEIAGGRYLFGVGDSGNSSGSSGTSATPGDAPTSETENPMPAESSISI